MSGTRVLAPRKMHFRQDRNRRALGDMRPFTFSQHRRKLKLDRLKRRGKSPPKKGEGKRASKK